MDTSKLLVTSMNCQLVLFGHYTLHLIQNLHDLPNTLRGGAITIGNFDGVHRGHARLIDELAASAKRVGGPAIVFTFDPHPVRLLRPEHAPPPLTWTDRKAELLASLGVDALIAYPTDDALLALSPSEFFADIVETKLAAKAMVEGPNFFFGKKRSGDISTLATLCEAADIHLNIVQPVETGGEFVSSSRIRNLIANGDLKQANAFLTQPYRIRGMVTHGAARGARIGFPTANLDAVDTLLPGVGVYAGAAEVAGKNYAAAINIGPNPTFGEDARKIEAHLLDFNDSIYGQPLEVEFFVKLRDTTPFNSLQELQDQLAKDVAATRQMFAECGER